ncbi:hypothetical protein QQP08_002668 [Theobroma cacao]|nr:hypothetical protein QQP08_002668 [Theobroma cacao]
MYRRLWESKVSGFLFMLESEVAGGRVEDSGNFHELLTLAARIKSRTLSAIQKKKSKTAIQKRKGKEEEKERNESVSAFPIPNVAPFLFY